MYKPKSGLIPTVAKEFSKAKRNNEKWLWKNFDRGGKPGTNPDPKDKAVQIEHAKRTAGNITALPWNTPDGRDLSAVAGANNVLVLWDNDTPMFFDKAESKIVESFGRAYVKKTKDAQYYDPKTTKDLYDKNKQKFNSYYNFVMRHTSDPNRAKQRPMECTRGGLRLADGTTVDANGICARIRRITNVSFGTINKVHIHCPNIRHVLTKYTLIHGTRSPPPASY